MFGFFSKKKAAISLELHSSDITFSDILTGNISIIPLEDDALETIEFEFNWKQNGVFSNDEPFKKSITKPVSLLKEQNNSLSFEVDFVSREEVNTWYRANSRRGQSAWSDFGDRLDRSPNTGAFLEELKIWEMKVTVEVGGSRVSATTEFEITF